MRNLAKLLSATLLFGLAAPVAAKDDCESACKKDPVSGVIGV